MVARQFSFGASLSIRFIKFICVAILVTLLQISTLCLENIIYLSLSLTTCQLHSSPVQHIDCNIDLKPSLSLLSHSFLYVSRAILYWPNIFRRQYTLASATLFIIDYYTVVPIFFLLSFMCVNIYIFWVNLSYLSLVCCRSSGIWRRGATQLLLQEYSLYYAR